MHTLKSYVHKFIALATVKFDSDSSLRPPNCAEMQQADRAVWEKIAFLYNEQGWSLDDSIHEFTEIRSDLHSLLQPRPKPVPASYSNIAKGKSKGKAKSKGAGRGKGNGSRPSWIPSMIKDGKQQAICLKYNQKACSLPDCKFLHVCCHAKPNGTACGGSHPALEHKEHQI